jgi:hypothetical protein
MKKQYIKMFDDFEAPIGPELVEYKGYEVRVPFMEKYGSYGCAVFKDGKPVFDTKGPAAKKHDEAVKQGMSWVDNLFEEENGKVRKTTIDNILSVVSIECQGFYEIINRESAEVVIKLTDPDYDDKEIQRNKIVKAVYDKFSEQVQEIVDNEAGHIIIRIK